MALTVFNASCLAKWPWREADDDDSEACCDEGDDASIASGSGMSLQGSWLRSKAV